MVEVKIGDGGGIWCCPAVVYCGGGCIRSERTNAWAILKKKIKIRRYKIEKDKYEGILVLLCALNGVTQTTTERGGISYDIPNHKDH